MPVITAKVSKDVRDMVERLRVAYATDKIPAVQEIVSIAIRELYHKKVIKEVKP